MRKNCTIFTSTASFTCPWEDTLLTLVVSPSTSKVDAYVERCSAKKGQQDDERKGVEYDESWVEHKSKKRKFDESAAKAAMPYMPRDQKEAWTDFGDGLKHRSFEADFMQNKVPEIGVRLCGCLGNAVKIVSPSPHAIQVLKKKHEADALVMYQ